jgi:hypothetical protein
MIKSRRQALIAVLATTALAFGVAGYSPAQTPAGHQVLTDTKLQAAQDQSPKENTRLPMQTAAFRSELSIPPLDAAVPAQTQTATFGLG